MKSETTTSTGYSGGSVCNLDTRPLYALDEANWFIRLLHKFGLLKGEVKQCQISITLTEPKTKKKVKK